MTHLLSPLVWLWLIAYVVVMFMIDHRPLKVHAYALPVRRRRPHWIDFTTPSGRQGWYHGL